MLNKSNSKLTNFYKKHRLIITCLLTSIPIIVIGILAMIFLYQPIMTWQKNARSWLLPVMILVYCLIVEFILVVIPLIMIHKKNKIKQNNTKTSD